MSSAEKDTALKSDVAADMKDDNPKCEKEHPEKNPTRSHQGKRSINTARNICILIVFISIIVGLLLRLGWGTLSSIGVDAVAYVCPLGALETLVAGKEFIPRLIIALICVVLFVALFGRLFCSWICVVPPLRRFFHPKDKTDRKNAAKNASSADEKSKDVSEKTDDQPEGSSAHACTTCSDCSTKGGCTALENIGGRRDGLQLDSRHGVLAGALISSAICGFPVFCLVCPIGLSIALVVGIYSAIFEQNPTVSILIFLAIILIELAFFRKWCSKICPVGAFMSLVGVKAPLLKPRVDASKCLRTSGVDCRVCVHECPELLDPHSKDIPECTRCGKCIDACPAKAISFRKPKKGPAASPVAAE